VLGSARIGRGDARWAEAHELGALLAERGFTVVTGGYGGLMAATSQGASEHGGHVIGLPMRGWEQLRPNPWNAELRWADGYGSRLDHLLRCGAIVGLPGGVGTLSEVSVTWAAAQTEVSPPPIVLLGDCWPPLIRAIGRRLVVDEGDLRLLRVVDTPKEAVEEVVLALRSAQTRARHASPLRRPRG
jgi:uncharacterized protein (TIGR00730 family)